MQSSNLTLIEQIEILQFEAMESSSDIAKTKLLEIAIEKSQTLKQELLASALSVDRTTGQDLTCTLNNWATAVGTTNQLTIGARIRELRKDRQLTQGDLAAATDVTTQAISLWENDNATMSVDKLIPLAAALKCDPMWLLTGEATRQSPATPDHQSRHHHSERL